MRRWLWIEIPAATVTSVEPSADEFAQAQAETHASEQREAAEQAQIQVKWRCVLDLVAWTMCLKRWRFVSGGGCGFVAGAHGDPLRDLRPGPEPLARRP